MISIADVKVSIERAHPFSVFGSPLGTQQIDGDVLLEVSVAVSLGFLTADVNKPCRLEIKLFSYDGPQDDHAVGTRKLLHTYQFTQPVVILGQPGELRVPFTTVSSATPGTLKKIYTTTLRAVLLDEDQLALQPHFVQGLGVIWTLDQMKDEVQAEVALTQIMPNGQPSIQTKPSPFVSLFVNTST